MSEKSNIKTVESVYEAFGRGDVAAILETVTDDVDWSTEAAGKGAPWYGGRNGKEALAQWFGEIGSTIDVEEFTPRAFGSNDTDVFTVVHFRARVRSTGKAVDMDLHHWFRFVDGKIAYYRGTEDTAATSAAFG